MLAIPSPTSTTLDQVLLVQEDLGVLLLQIYGADSLEIVHKWNLKKMNRFSEQSGQNQGEF